MIKNCLKLEILCLFFYFILSPIKQGFFRVSVSLSTDLSELMNLC